MEIEPVSEGVEPVASSAQEGDQDDSVDMNLSSVSDTSLVSSDDGDCGNGTKTLPTESKEPSLVNISDISSDLDNDPLLSEDVGDAPVNQAGETRDTADSSVTQDVESSAPVSQPEGSEDAPSNQPVVAKDTTSKEVSEEVMKSADSAEIGKVDSISEAASTVLPLEDVPHPLPVESVSLQGSAPPSPTAIGTPTKTSGKRKVQYTHYTFINKTRRRGWHILSNTILSTYVVRNFVLLQPC